MPTALPGLAVFLAGAALVVAAVRWWRRELSWGEGLLYVGLTTLLFARPLLTGAIQIPTDLAYETRPWSETVAEPVVPRNRLVEDTLLEQLPFHTLVRRRLLAGEVPLWSHELGTGQPLLGNVQSAPLAPLHLLALPLAPLRGLTVAAAWAVLLHLLLTRALAGALGAGRLAAALAAVATALSSHAVAWAYDTPGMCSAWIPGVLLGIVLLARAERGALPGLVACLVGLAASGHPETLAHAALAGAAAAAALAWRMPLRRLRSFAAGLAAAALLSSALSAPVLLPFAQALPTSQRWTAIAEDGPDDLRPPPAEARYLLPLIDPLAFGGPFGTQWSGPLNFTEMCTDYAGILTLALAVAGAAAWRGRILALLVGGLAALLPALRVHPFFDLLSAVPVLGQAAHARLRLLWVLAVALAAGLALDRFAASSASPDRLSAPGTHDRLGKARWIRVSSGSPRARWKGRWQARWRELRDNGVFWQWQARWRELRDRGDFWRRACAVAVIALAGLLLLCCHPAPGPWEDAWWGIALAGLGAAAATLSVPRWRPFFAPTALAAVAADLFVLGAPFHPSLPPSFDLAPPPALAFLGARAKSSSEPFRVLALGHDLPPNLAAVYGLWDPRGNDPMRPADPLDLLGPRLQPNHEVGQLLVASPGAPDVALDDFLAVRYLLVRHRRQLPPPWRPVFDGAGGRVWENSDALPLFFMPRRFARFAGRGEALRATLGNADFADLAVAAGAAGATMAPIATMEKESPMPAGGSSSGVNVAAQSGRVTHILARSNGFDLEVTSGGGIVASSVSYDPGWRVAIDRSPEEEGPRAPAREGAQSRFAGERLRLKPEAASAQGSSSLEETGPGRREMLSPAPGEGSVLEVNAGFLGFAVPAGTHRVHLDYRPGGWTWGLALFGLGLASLAATGARSLLARRRVTRACAKGAEIESRLPALVPEVGRAVAG